MIAIAIVEPQRLTRIGIEQVISTSPTLHVVASVAEMTELHHVDVDVILLSSRAGHGSTVSFRELCQRAGVLVVTDTPTPAELRASIQAGVGGYVTPDVGDSELTSAITAVAAGAFYLMAGLAAYLHGGQNHEDDTVAKPLARREVETLQLIASGYTHSQIARRMGLTEATINTYVKRIRAKLNAGNKAELTRKAIDLGYVYCEQPRAVPRSGRPVLTSVPTLSRSA